MIESLEARRLLSTTAQFYFPTTVQTLGPQTLTLTFDADESSALTSSMVTLKNLTAGDDIYVSAPTFSNGGTQATFTFDAYLDDEGNSHSLVGDNGISGWLPNGYYRVKLSAADLPSIGQDFSSDFYFIAADANNDGKLNIDDYGRIDSHIGDPTSSGYTEGDFNLDGRINIDDYGIIDSHVGYGYHPPGAVALYSPTTTEIDLDWVATTKSDVHEYTIYRSTDPNFTASQGTLLDVVDTSEYKDVQLVPNTTYYYLVNQLHDDGSESEVGTDPSGTTRSNDPHLPSTPANFSATPINNLEIQLSWTPVGKNTSDFVIQRTLDSDPGDWVTVATVSPKANTWTDRQRSDEVLYDYRMAAANSRGTSDYTLTQTARIEIANNGHQSMIVIVGGHFQHMSYLDFDGANPDPKSGNGVGGIAKRLRQQGYNVYLFSEYHDEDVNANGRGVALDEIEQEIQDDGIQYVTFMGYSHGASACKHLSQSLHDDLTFNPYVVSFVGYVDAIQRIAIDDFVPAFAETGTPVGMETGVNYWEPNGTFLIHGTNVNGMDNVQFTIADDGGRITHINIPKQYSIWSDLVNRVETNMPQT